MERADILPSTGEQFIVSVHGVLDFLAFQDGILVLEEGHGAGDDIAKRVADGIALEGLGKGEDDIEGNDRNYRSSDHGGQGTVKQSVHVHGEWWVQKWNGAVVGPLPVLCVPGE